MGDSYSARFWSLPICPYVEASEMLAMMEQILDDADQRADVPPAEIARALCEVDYRWLECARYESQRDGQPTPLRPDVLARRVDAWLDSVWSEQPFDFFSDLVTIAFCFRSPRGIARTVAAQSSSDAKVVRRADESIALLARKPETAALLPAVAVVRGPPRRPKRKPPRRG